MINKPSSVDFEEDFLDIRDLIARFEYIENIRLEMGQIDEWVDEYDDEFNILRDVLRELRGQGGDEQWQGSWYPCTLIKEDYFEEYARQLAEDVGSITDNMTWPCNFIDWQEAAEQLQMDYSSIEIAGTTFWYR